MGSKQLPHVILTTLFQQRPSGLFINYCPYTHIFCNAMANFLVCKSIALKNRTGHWWSIRCKPLNAVSNVIIVSGEIGTPNETWKGPTIPVVLQRQSVPSLETGVLDDYATKIENRTFSDYCKPYPDPPFEIPAAANLTLQIRLGNVLSEGQSSIVFKCECFIPYGNETLEYIIPPMVVKLAKRYKSDDVKKEAIMYEGIKCLQGSSIPRCYGFFQVRWDMMIYLHIWIIAWLIHFSSALEFFDFGPMSILLLEELGGLLSLDQPVPDSTQYIIYFTTLMDHPEIYFLLLLGPI